MKVIVVDPRYGVLKTIGEKKVCEASRDDHDLSS